MVTHDLDTLARTCDRVAVLVDGKVIVDTLEGIVANEHPWIRQYFHGARGRAGVAAGGARAWSVTRSTRRSPRSRCWPLPLRSRSSGGIRAAATGATIVRYEIYFDGSVSGLARGSPVRYLGVDVGRVRSLAHGRATTRAG